MATNVSMQLGINYSWGDVKLMLFGTTPIIGVTAIDYGEDQEIEPSEGAGNFPVGVGFGMFKYKGSVTLYREEIQNILPLAPLGKLQLIPPFPIKIVRGNISQRLIIDTLPFCIFKNNGVDTKSGDKKMTTKIELFLGNIAWGQ